MMGALLPEGRRGERPVSGLAKSTLKGELGSLSPVYFMRRGTGIPSVGEWLPRVDFCQSDFGWSDEKSDNE